MIRHAALPATTRRHSCECGKRHPWHPCSCGNRYGTARGLSTHIARARGFISVTALATIMKDLDDGWVLERISSCLSADEGGGPSCIDGDYGLTQHGHGIHLSPLTYPSAPLVHYVQVPVAYMKRLKMMP